MKKVVFLGVIFVSAALQITWIDSFKVFTVKPDLLLMLAVTASLCFNFKEAIFLCIFAGLLKDALGAGGFGLNTLLFCLWSFLLSLLNRQISFDNEIFRAVIIGVVALLHNILLGLIPVYTGRIVPPGIFLRIILLEPLFTTLVFLWLSKALRDQKVFRIQLFPHE
jgi:rod shape-determining protein MreD